MPDSMSMLPPSVQVAAQNAALDATAASVTRVETSTPNVSLVTYAPLIGKIATIFLGGFLTRQGIDVSAWTGQDWVLIVGLAVSIGGGVWAWIGKQVQARREHQIALASAAASAAATQATGERVEVAIQPPATRTA